ncbi:Uncharacterised protein [Mycobacteroides abscessus subsp. abscessus]|nr:Uncharacterised protein [Mycobacteroides abscessus subsp. abscessus]
MSASSVSTRPSTAGEARKNIAVQADQHLGSRAELLGGNHLRWIGHRISGRPDRGKMCQPGVIGPIAQQLIRLRPQEGHRGRIRLSRTTAGEMAEKMRMHPADNLFRVHCALITLRWRPAKGSHPTRRRRSPACRYR